MLSLQCTQIANIHAWFPSFRNATQLDAPRRNSAARCRLPQALVLPTFCDVFVEWKTLAVRCGAVRCYTNPYTYWRKPRVREQPTTPCKRSILHWLLSVIVDATATIRAMNAATALFLQVFQRKCCNASLRCAREVTTIVFTIWQTATRSAAYAWTGPALECAQF